MVQRTQLMPYSDDSGNLIICDEESHAQTFRATFRGSNNRLIVRGRPHIDRLLVDFDCDNGLFEVEAGGSALRISARVGQDSTIRLGRNVTTTQTVGMSATEGTTIAVGVDVMFATNNQIRADDGHPIFDIRTGKRINVSRDITIGDHVWIGWGAWVLGGVTIGSGAVVGACSVVTRSLPNNVVAAGSPARVVRRDVAWERPHLSRVKPYYKPDASVVTRSKYWQYTADSSGASPTTMKVRWRFSSTRLWKAVGRRLRRHRRQRDAG